MVSYVLDASAILRLLDREEGGDRVAEIIKLHISGKGRALVSTIHWGEVMGITCKRHGMNTMEIVREWLSDLMLDLVPASAERAESSALIKLRYGIPYADAFGVELASAAKHVLVTADFDVKPAEKDIKIEFLPKKT